MSTGATRTPFGHAGLHGPYRVHSQGASSLSQRDTFGLTAVPRALAILLPGIC